MFPFIEVEEEFKLVKDKRANKAIVLYLLLTLSYNLLVGIVLSLLPVYVFYWILY
jgi:hypothetical protein